MSSFTRDVRHVLHRTLLWCGVAVLGLSCIATVLAQGRGDPGDTGGVLAALTAEIRQLRIAVEQSTRSQARTQALAVYLSAQQTRLVQVAGRLDSARKEFDTAAARSREISVQIAFNDDEIVRTADSKMREMLEERKRVLKRDQPLAELQEQQTRNREGELAQILQTEDARWADLLSQLEQLVNK